ncbi:hypothetical protein GCM10009799_13730 [Nocardiopsis rhodophaea]|uniref:Uncharacterized protein n=1 Tax=Nocardiopsis rhodophaea TaxID=280238 RepID=A0ABN2SM79_9ACTN
MTADAVRAADDAGYLVGPYDSWANAQDPAESDAPTSTWPEGVYPGDCVIGADGRPKAGFHDRGCYLSSQAIADNDATRAYLDDRVKEMTANGATSYFLDVDAAGELFDDYSPDHPMTRAQDRGNRIERMGRLSEEDGLVLGSESAVGWANQVIAFSHGSLTPVADGLWAVERDRENWGGYAPGERSQVLLPARDPARERRHGHVRPRLPGAAVPDRPARRGDQHRPLGAAPVQAPPPGA